MIMKASSSRQIKRDETSNSRISERPPSSQIRPAESSDSNLIDLSDTTKEDEQPLLMRDLEYPLPNCLQHATALPEFQQPPPYESLADLNSAPEKSSQKKVDRALLWQDIGITCSFKGYEDGMRTCFEQDTKNPPTISLWVRSGSQFHNQKRKADSIA